jgi:hypothetical protein
VQKYADKEFEAEERRWSWQKRGGGVGRRDTGEGREYECHRIMVVAEMVKGG